MVDALDETDDARILRLLSVFSNSSSVLDAFDLITECAQVIISPQPDGAVLGASNNVAMLCNKPNVADGRVVRCADLGDQGALVAVKLKEMIQSWAYHMASFTILIDKPQRSRCRWPPRGNCRQSADPKHCFQW